MLRTIVLLLATAGLAGCGCDIPDPTAEQGSQASIGNTFCNNTNAIAATAAAERDGDDDDDGAGRDYDRNY